MPEIPSLSALDSGASLSLLNTTHFHLGITWFQRRGSSLRSMTQAFGLGQANQSESQDFLKESQDTCSTPLRALRKDRN